VQQKVEDEWVPGRIIQGDTERERLFQANYKTDPIKLSSDFKIMMPEEIIKWTMDYLNYHKGVKPAKIEIPVKSLYMHNLCEHKWDAEFINMVHSKGDDELIYLNHFATLIHCESLINLTSAKSCLLVDSQMLVVNRLEEKELKDIGEKIAELKRLKSLGNENFIQNNFKNVEVKKYIIDNFDELEELDDKDRCTELIKMIKNEYSTEHKDNFSNILEKIKNYQ
jgi:hypothetical protein